MHNISNTFIYKHHYFIWNVACFFLFTNSMRTIFFLILLSTFFFISQVVFKYIESDWNTFYELNRRTLFTYVNCCHSKITSNRKITFSYPGSTTTADWDYNLKCFCFFFGFLFHFWISKHVVQTPRIPKSVIIIISLHETMPVCRIYSWNLLSHSLCYYKSQEKIKLVTNWSTISFRKIILSHLIEAHFLIYFFHYALCIVFFDEII